MPGETVKVNSLRYDRTVRRTWTARLVSENEDVIELVGEFAEDVEHADLGLICKGTISHEYYWRKSWYNVFRFEETGGGLRNFYCNIAMPFTLRAGVLEYVDLDIDIVVWPGGRLEVLDMEEFEQNTVTFRYSAEVIATAGAALAELMAMIGERRFPFSAGLDAKHVGADI